MQRAPRRHRRLRRACSRSMRSAPTRSSPAPAGPPPSLGRAGGYRVTLASTGGGAGARRERARARHRAAARSPPSASTPWSWPGGSGADAAGRRRALVGWIRAAAPRCRRVATVCSGAFLGAAAGLLDGRRVTTHWARADQLPRRIPALRSTPTRSTSATGSSGRAPASRRGSTSRWRWSRTTSGSTSPRRWPAGW